MNIKEQIEAQQKQALDELITWAGGESNLAILLDTSPQVVHGWSKRGRISATMAAEAEKQSRGKFTKKQLRPEVIDWRV